MSFYTIHKAYTALGEAIYNLPHFTHSEDLRNIETELIELADYISYVNKNPIMDEIEKGVYTQRSPPPVFEMEDGEIEDARDVDKLLDDKGNAIAQ
jgi:hypothetical protein